MLKDFVLSKIHLTSTKPRDQTQTTSLSIINEVCMILGWFTGRDSDHPRKVHAKGL